jgi:hypothetical protein
MQADNPVRPTLTQTLLSNFLMHFEIRNAQNNIIGYASCFTIIQNRIMYVYPTLNYSILPLI